ncbi:hypothetical protein TNCV_1579641 [Trichonephila clavipes]|nr:hypothetical protein TNCV_1579641 [Trichonephila clavipes]
MLLPKCSDRRLRSLRRSGAPMEPSTSPRGLSPIYSNWGLRPLMRSCAPVSLQPFCIVVCSLRWKQVEHGAVGSLVVRASHSRPEGLGSMPPNTLRAHTEYVLVKSVVP